MYDPSNVIPYKTAVQISRGIRPKSHVTAINLLVVQENVQENDSELGQLNSHSPSEK